MTSRSCIVDATKLTSRKVEQFHQYWRGKCANGVLPSRAAIDPTEIPRFLRHLVLAEIEPEPMRIRYRLVGTGVVEVDGFDYTNRYLDECNFAVEPLLLQCYRRLIATHAPVFAYYEWNKSDWRRPGAVGVSETGFFPLSNDGATIDFAISIADSTIRPYPLDAI